MKAVHGVFILPMCSLVVMGVLSALPAHAQVAASRTVDPGAVQPLVSTAVSVAFTVDPGAPPGSVILTENVPPGWSVWNTTPPATSVDTSTGEISWLMGNTGVPGIELPVADTTFSYILTPPEGAAATVYPLDGRMDFLVSGEPESVTTGGTTGVTVLPPSIPGDNSFPEPVPGSPVSGSAGLAMLLVVILAAALRATRRHGVMLGCLLVASQAVAQVSAERSLTAIDSPRPGSAAAAIQLSVDEASNPNAVIVLEYIPAGWEVVGPHPQHALVSSDGRELRWLLGGMEKLANTELRYTLVPEEGLAPGSSAVVSGVLRLTEDGEPVEIPINGDGNVAVPEPGEEGPGPIEQPADVTRSGSVTAIDVQLVINASLGVPTGHETDINGDGRTDAVDVQLVINAALGIEITL